MNKMFCKRKDKKEIYPDNIEHLIEAIVKINDLNSETSFVYFSDAKYIFRMEYRFEPGQQIIYDCLDKRTMMKIQGVYDIKTDDYRNLFKLPLFIEYMRDKKLKDLGV